MKSMSEQLTELSDRSKRTEDLIAAARERNRDKLIEHQAKLKAALTSAKESATAEREAGEEKADARLAEVRSSMTARFDSLRADATDRREARGVSKAEHHAARAEQDAYDSVDLLMYAMDQAEWAIADAVLARADADDLATRA